MVNQCSASKTRPRLPRLWGSGKRASKWLQRWKYFVVSQCSASKTRSALPRLWGKNPVSGRSMLIQLAPALLRLLSRRSLYPIFGFSFKHILGARTKSKSCMIWPQGSPMELCSLHTSDLEPHHELSLKHMSILCILTAGRQELNSVLPLSSIRPFLQPHMRPFPPLEFGWKMYMGTR